MKKKNSSWNNPWTITIVGGVIVGIGLQIFGLIPWNKIINLIGIIFSWIWSVFTGEIKTNLFILLLIFFFGIILRRIYNSIKKLFKDDSISSAQASTNITQPDFLKYKEDTFNNMLYRWRWVRDNRGALIVNDILPFCPRCKCRLVGDYCPNCKDSYYGRIQDFHDVEALIHHKIDGGNF